MAETVLITTKDLEPAVRLRDAFAADGLDVELITPGERIADVRDPVLLVLTGALDEKQARRLSREAHDLGLPIVALVDRPSDAENSVAQLGVTEAFIKPVQPDDVASVGRRLIQRGRLREITGIVGETDAMVEVLERIIQIAPVASTVLVTGESGTGKERVARGIHALSPRRSRPFIAANVAALTETLLESELFGHEKGAFTGAVGQRKGFFELANRGTLFLDEIGEMPVTTQAKLLRVLEERSFMRVGGESEISVDVRVIAATNQELRQLVATGRFRRDLYYRLNVLSIQLPSLRERRADIPLLVDTFIRKASDEHDRPRIIISPEAMELLIDAPWPGNVRELKNLVEAMVVLAPGSVIRPQDIPPEIRSSRRTGTLLPAPIPLPTTPETSRGATPPPELEFIFHTLLQLRIDMEDLRRQFDEYRETRPDLSAGFPLGHAIGSVGTIHQARTGLNEIELAEEVGGGSAGYTGTDLEDEESVVVYRPGMTLADMERAAITAALQQVGGNRRKAAEMLGMGERTLYRKIKEYDIPL
jgi:DNA-binding NtrC family response regulator